MRLDIAAQTHVGRRKANNEDYFGVFREDAENTTFFREGAMLCVADGLGGHTGGEIASKLTVSIVRDILKEPEHGEVTETDREGMSDQGPFPVLRDAVKRANDSIYQTNKDLVKKGKPMATTITAALVEPKRVYVANVGDSRCYHIREGAIIDQTEDHSWVDEQVKQGKMSKAEAAVDARRNVITRCIGTHAEVEVDPYRWNLAPGDSLLLCTDGLVNMVPDEDIAGFFQRGGTAADIANQLVTLANENGGKDNITVIVAHISPNPLRQLKLRIRSFFRKHAISWSLAIFLIVFGLLCGIAGYLLAWKFPLH